MWYTLKQATGLALLRGLGAMPHSSNGLLHWMQQSLAAFGCRLVWGKGLPLSLPPFCLLSTWRRDVAYVWWKWWLMSQMAVEYKRIAVGQQIYSLLCTNELAFAQSVVRVMLGVIKRFGMRPALHNDYRHEDFLRYFGIVCDTAYCLVVESGGNDDPFPLIESYLQELDGVFEDKTLQAAQVTEGYEESVAGLKRVCFNAWVIYEVYSQVRRIITGILQEPP